MTFTPEAGDHDSVQNAAGVVTVVRVLGPDEVDPECGAMYEVCKVTDSRRPPYITRHAFHDELVVAPHPDAEKLTAHLRTTHTEPLDQINAFTSEYTANYPEMDPIAHLHHLHTLFHDSGESDHAEGLHPAAGWS
jgi:hypothetical protein